MTLRAGVVVACVILGACAEQREEIIETNVPLYMEAGAAAAVAPAQASAQAVSGGGTRGSGIGDGARA